MKTLKKKQSENKKLQDENIKKIQLLKEELNLSKSTASEYLNQIKRVQAEFDNYRKRMEKITAEKFEAGVKSLTQELLSVLDNFERALKAKKLDLKGVELVYREFSKILTKKGLRKMDGYKKFDYHFHHALNFIETEEKDGKIIDVVAPGYFWNNEVLRAAEVIVNKKKIEKK